MSAGATNSTDDEATAQASSTVLHWEEPHNHFASALSTSCPSVMKHEGEWPGPFPLKSTLPRHCWIASIVTSAKCKDAMRSRGCLAKATTTGALLLSTCVRSGTLYDADDDAACLFDCSKHGGKSRVCASSARPQTEKSLSFLSCLKASYNVSRRRRRRADV